MIPVLMQMYACSCMHADVCMQMPLQGVLCAPAVVMRARQTAALVLLCPCRRALGRLCPESCMPLTGLCWWALRKLLL